MPKPNGYVYALAIDAKVTFPERPSREKLREAVKAMKLDYLTYIADDFIDIGLVNVEKVNISIFPHDEK